MIILLLKILITNSESTTNQQQTKSKSIKMYQTNNMSSFTMQIITTANQINGVKKNISSIQYFASRN